MRLIATTIGAALVLLSTSTIMAHDGHGHMPEQGSSPIHYMTEPIHLLPLAIVGILLMALVYGLKRGLVGKLQHSTVARKR